MLVDDVVCLLDGFGIKIVQGSDVIHIKICDNFLTYVRLNRKDLFEGQNQLFVLRFNCSDNELSSFSFNNQK